MKFWGIKKKLEQKIKDLESRIERKSSFVNIGSMPAGSFVEFALAQQSNQVRAAQAMKFYRENSSVATAVDLIADSFEQIDPVLRIEDGTFIDEHELIDMLNRPNGFQTWQEFGGMLSRHYLLTHDSHIYAAGNINRPPIQVYSVKPQLVTPQEDMGDGYPVFYAVNQGVGSGQYNRNEKKNDARFYSGNLKELYHIMGFSSRNVNIEGDSPLLAAALETKQQIQGRIHNLSLLKQGGRLSLIVAFKEEDRVDPEELLERKNKILEAFSGPDGEKIAVVSGTEVDIKEAGTTNKDMDYAELDRIAGQAIYLRYKIPLPLISNDASTFDNMKTAVTLFYDMTVLPHADTLFSGMSKMLLPRYGLDPAKVQITYNPDTITALMDRRLQQLERRRKVNIETTNELRALLPNREDIEGGDVLYQQANLIPIGEDLKDSLDDNS